MAFQVNFWERKRTTCWFYKSSGVFLKMFFGRLGLECGFISWKFEGLSVKVPVRGRWTAGSISIKDDRERPDLSLPSGQSDSWGHPVTWPPSHAMELATNCIKRWGANGTTPVSNPSPPVHATLVLRGSNPTSVLQTRIMLIFVSKSNFAAMQINWPGEIFSNKLQEKAKVGSGLPNSSKWRKRVVLFHRCCNHRCLQGHVDQKVGFRSSFNLILYVLTPWLRVAVGNALHKGWFTF